MCLRCAQMFSDVHGRFQKITDVFGFSLDILHMSSLMFSGCSLDVPRMLRWVLWVWWNLMIISNKSMDFNDPKESNDPQVFDDPSYSLIPSYLMINWKNGL